MASDHASGPVVPIILCGGSGTRLWPLSRRDRPKPFLPLLGERSLLQQTLARCGDAARYAAPIVVAGAQHSALIEEQASEVRGLRIAVEPEGRNTAPAIALAAALLPDDAVMLVCPSDHHVADEVALQAGVDAAVALTRRGRLVAFGIAPDRPETGYGYIERGAAIDGGFAVARFVEKPTEAVAREFLDRGGYDWNGGIFAFRAGDFLRELEHHRPEMTRAVRQAVGSGSWHGKTFHPDREPFVAIEPESVDYAVMENTDRAAVVPVDMGWSDIGNWAALRDARAAAGLGGTGNVELVDCENVMVCTDGPRVSCVGLNDVIVVVDGDEVLVTTAAGAQKVGKLRGASGQ